MKLHLFALREAETDLDEASAAAPTEAKQTAKALDALLAIGRLPTGIRQSLSSARSELRKRLPVWGELQQDGDEEPPVDDPPPATEAEVETFEGLPLAEATTGDGEFNVRIIRPGWGSSGYYSANTLKKASEAGTFPKGLKMYWNHPTKTEDRERPERDLRDLAGELTEQARWQESGPEGPGLYAKVRTFGPYKASVKELAPHIGLSIRGAGSGHLGEAEGRKGRIIEAIVGAKSVDFVTAPGAGGKVIDLFEAARNQTSQEDDMDLQEAIRAKDEAEKHARELEEARANDAKELARLREAVATSEAANFIKGKLATVKLPDATKQRLVSTVAMKASLTDGKLDEAALGTTLDEAVKAEVEYLESIMGSGRISGMGGGDGGADDKTVEEADKALAASFAAFGLSEAATKTAVSGR